MHSNIQSPPSNFGEVVSRLAPPAVPGASHCRPVVGSVTELADGVPVSEPSMWVIMHTITNSAVHLYHPRPLCSRKLAVRIEGPAGEVVQVMLTAVSTTKQGEIYETTANFYR